MDAGFGRDSVIAGLGDGADDAWRAQTPPGLHESPTFDAPMLPGQTTLPPPPELVPTLPAPTPPPAPAPDNEKYQVVAPIGRGGMGEVFLIRDRDLRRDIAMKVMREEYASIPAMKRKFVAEAQATSQLEHPGIPPVHDIGTRPDGSLYFTMKVVRGRTLTHVLRDLLLGVKPVRKEFTLHRLISVLERISEALEFAHEKGVIHRDLKPENIMLGSYGEVHVMDWGLAKVGVHGSTSESHDGNGDGFESGALAVRTDATDLGERTLVGAIQGTVAYMSPEQARGETLDARSDIYALGVILYETLTLHRAFENGPDLLTRVRAGTVPPVETRNAERTPPEPLASLCRRAMSADPAGRPPSAKAFGTELRAWLDGRAERERRHQEAEVLFGQGRTAAQELVTATKGLAAAERAEDAAAAAVKPWQTLDEKASLIAARERTSEAREHAAECFADAANYFGGALLAEPSHARARASLADLWRARLEDAESRGARDDAEFALRVIRRTDDGRLAAYLQGDGTLSLGTDPPGATAVIHRLSNHRGLLVPDAGRSFGTTPIAPTPLAMGTYLVVISLRGFPDLRYPVHITRGRAWRGQVSLHTAEEIGAGFVAIPAGPFVAGEGKNQRIESVGDFAIARAPVTFGEWAEFLAAVERESGLDAARALIPRVAGDGDYMERRADGTWAALANNCEGAARVRCLREHGADFERLLPVAGISWHDATEYCAWKMRTTGQQWRLPTDLEREKAARGVDGRRFPWGDIEDSTLGKCQDSRDERSQAEPVGCFPAATSIYGVLDASGNSFDWTDSWFDARQATRVTRGGAWYFPASYLRCAFRGQLLPTTRSGSVGLRPARTLRS